MAKKNKALGTILQVKLAGVYTTIAQRSEIDGPDNSVEVKELLDLDSTSKEKAPTLPDGGELSLKLWFDPNDSLHATLYGWSQNPPDPNPDWRLIFPITPSKGIDFRGVLSGFKVGGMTPDGYLMADVKIAVDGVTALW